MNTKKINKAVFLALQSCKYSQIELAKKLGMDRSYISKLINLANGAYSIYLARRLRVAFPFLTNEDLNTTLVIETECKNYCLKLLY